MYNYFFKDPEGGFKVKGICTFVADSNMNLVGRQVFRGPSLTFFRILAAKCSSQNPDLKGYIDTLVKKGPVVVFMKGTPDQPRCGFSNAVVQILRFHGVNQFDAYNVLQDENLRQGIYIYMYIH